MLPKQEVQTPLNNHSVIIAKPRVSSAPVRFYEYETAIEKRNIDIKIELLPWTKRVFNAGRSIITVFSRLLKWSNGIGSNKIDLRRMERRSDRQLGMRKWNL
jgi:hypothetical protein